MESVHVQQIHPATCTPPKNKTIHEHTRACQDDRSSPLFLYWNLALPFVSASQFGLWWIHLEVSLNLPHTHTNKQKRKQAPPQTPIQSILTPSYLLIGKADGQREKLSENTPSNQLSLKDWTPFHGSMSSFSAARLVCRCPRLSVSCQSGSISLSLSENLQYRYMDVSLQKQKITLTTGVLGGWMP